jgi:cell division protein FtsZ
VLQQGVRSITDLMVMPGLINLDFADVRSVMAEMGKAMMGTGEGSGEHRALEAAERAIANPLLDGVSMQGAKGVIISIIGGDDMKLLEVDEAANHIRELVDPNANIIWGSAFNPDLQGKIRVSVVATGIEQTAQMAEEASRPFTMNAARGPARPSIAARRRPAPQPIIPPAGPALTIPQAPPASFAQAPAPAPATFTPLAPPAVPTQGMPSAPAMPLPPVEEPLELGAGFETPFEPAPRDELLLDASRLTDQDGPVAGVAKGWFPAKAFRRAMVRRRASPPRPSSPVRPRVARCSSVWPIWPGAVMARTMTMAATMAPSTSPLPGAPEQPVSTGHTADQRHIELWEHGVMTGNLQARARRRLALMPDAGVWGCLSRRGSGGACGGAGPVVARRVASCGSTAAR